MTYPLIVLFLFMAQACSDDDSTTTPEPEPLTVSEMLIGRWFFVSTTMAGETTIIEDECEKKSYLRFNTDGTVENVVFQIDGSDACVANYSYADYTLTSNETQLVFSVGPDAVLRDILLITESELVLQYDQTEVVFRKEGAMDTE